MSTVQTMSTVIARCYLHLRWYFFDREWAATLLVVKLPSNLKRDNNLFDKRMMGGYIAIQSLPHRGQHHQEEDQDLSDRGTKPGLLGKKAASSEDSK